MGKVPVDLGFLLYHRYIKEKNGNWVLTPRGEAFLQKEPAHAKTITEIIRSKNSERAAMREQLERILSARKQSSAPHSKGKAWGFPKPAAKPKKRRQLHP